MEVAGKGGDEGGDWAIGSVEGGSGSAIESSTGGSMSDSSGATGLPEAIRMRYIAVDILSVVCSLTTVITYLLIRRMRRHPVAMLFWIQLCDLLFVAIYLITFIKPELVVNTRFCTWQTALGEFFGLASMSWSFLVSFNLYITLRNPFRDTARFVKVYHIYVWALSTITLVVLLFKKSDASANLDGCWVKNSDYQLLTVVPLVIYFSFAIFVLITSIWTIMRVKALRKKTKHAAELSCASASSSTPPLEPRPSVELGSKHSHSHSGGGEKQWLIDKARVVIKTTEGKTTTAETSALAGNTFWPMFVRLTVNVCIMTAFWLGPVMHHVLNMVRGDISETARDVLYAIDNIGTSLQDLFLTALWLSYPPYPLLLLKKWCIRKARRIARRWKEFWRWLSCQRRENEGSVGIDSEVEQQRGLLDSQDERPEEKASDEEEEEREKQILSIWSGYDFLQRTALVLRRAILLAILQGIRQSVRLFPSSPLFFPLFSLQCHPLGT